MDSIRAGLIDQLFAPTALYPDRLEPGTIGRRVITPKLRRESTLCLTIARKEDRRRAQYPAPLRCARTPGHGKPRGSKGLTMGPALAPPVAVIRLPMDCQMGMTLFLTCIRRPLTEAHAVWALMR